MTLGKSLNGRHKPPKAEMTPVWLIIWRWFHIWKLHTHSSFLSHDVRKMTQWCAISWRPTAPSTPGPIQMTPIRRRIWRWFQIRKLRIDMLSGYRDIPIWTSNTEYIIIYIYNIYKIYIPQERLSQDKSRFRSRIGMRFSPLYSASNSAPEWGWTLFRIPHPESCDASWRTRYPIYQEP